MRSRTTSGDTLAVIHLSASPLLQAWKLQQIHKLEQFEACSWYYHASLSSSGASEQVNALIYWRISPVFYFLLQDSYSAEATDVPEKTDPVLQPARRI